MTISPTGRLDASSPTPYTLDNMSEVAEVTQAQWAYLGMDFSELEKRAIFSHPPCQLLSTNWSPKRGELMPLIYTGMRGHKKSWFWEEMKRRENEYYREWLRIKNYGVKTAVAEYIASLGR